MRPCLRPAACLSDLINPFGPQSAAGQALINSSYINGVYAARRGHTLERRRPCQPRAGRCLQCGHSGDRGARLHRGRRALHERDHAL